MTRRKYTGKGEFNEMPSITIPDQTMSIRTILERYAKGLPIQGEKTNPFYDTDEISEGLDLRKLDLVDMQELAKKNKEIIGQHKKGIEARKKAKEKTDYENEVARRVKLEIEGKQ